MFVTFFLFYLFWKMKLFIVALVIWGVVLAPSFIMLSFLDWRR